MKRDDSPSVIYEVALEIDPEIADDFDEWLRGHVKAMLALPGFESAEVLVPEGPTRRTGRTVRYRLVDRAALEDYLETHATSMRQEAIDRFGERFSASRKVLEVSESLAGFGEPAQPSCLNCGATLVGQYCSGCGQRARVRLITLWELFRDVVGDLFELDSRLWRSLIPLVFRPGKLTRDYLAGRRVYYMPPFRMYLIISLIFFLFSFRGADSDLEANLALDNTGPELSIVIPDPDESDEPAAQEDLEPNNDGHPTDAGDEFTAEDCEKIREEWEWTAFIEDELVIACQKIAADSGQSFLLALVDNIPLMMFVFLPILALVFKILYLGSGRYYVEHLLFFVHYHSFVFLVITATTLISSLGDSAEPMAGVAQMFVTVVALYIPIYLFKAMRRVYEQGFLVTSLKFSVLFFAYFFSLVLSLLITLLYTALTL